MDILKRIVLDREWNHNSEPLQVFEGRLRNMILLLSSTMAQNKVEDSVKLEARKQYFVMLVSCYETYLRDTFKEIITSNLVSIDNIKKIRCLRDLKFSLSEVEYIRNNEIYLSELLAEYINFQDFEEVFGIFSSWGFDKELDKRISSKDEVMPLPDKEFLKKTPDAGLFIIDFFKQLTTHRKLIDKDYMISKIKLLLEIRHKIVHKNIDISINQEDILELTLAVYEFIMSIESFVLTLELLTTK